MNQPYARVNQPYATLMLASPLREMFGVQLYKNNAHALPFAYLSILNLDWLQHARSVRGVYECIIWDLCSWLEESGCILQYFSFYLEVFITITVLLIGFLLLHLHCQQKSVTVILHRTRAATLSAIYQQLISTW